MIRHIAQFAVLLPLLFACDKKEEPALSPSAAQQTAPQPVTEQAGETAASPRKTSKPTIDKYTVAKGETLSRIAKKNGLNYRDLAKWNDIKDPDQIRVGQELRLTAPAS